MAIALRKLYQTLQDNGIPVIGLSGIGDPIGDRFDMVYADVRIDLAPEATAEQRALVDTLKASHTTSTPIKTFARSHALYQRKFLTALYALEQGVGQHTTQGQNLLADYQAALNDAMGIVNDLPQAYIDNLNAERDLAGLAIGVAGMTLVQCRQFALLLRGWLNTRLGFALATAQLD